MTMVHRTLSFDTWATSILHWKKRIYPGWLVSLRKWQVLNNQDICSLMRTSNVQCRFRKSTSFASHLIQFNPVHATTISLISPLKSQTHWHLNFPNDLFSSDSKTYVFINSVICVVKSAHLIFEILITTIIYGAVKQIGQWKQNCRFHKM